MPLSCSLFPIKASPGDLLLHVIQALRDTLQAVWNKEWLFALAVDRPISGRAPPPPFGRICTFRRRSILHRPSPEHHGGLQAFIFTGRTPFRVFFGVHGGYRKK